MPLPQRTLTSRLDATYRVRLRTFPSSGCAATLGEMPGVGVWKRAPGLFVPANASAVVKRMLVADGCEIASLNVVGERDIPLSLDAAAERAVGRGELHSTCWMKHMLPFQREATRDRYATDGGHIHAEAGSGKTRMSFVWAILADGPVVVITTPKAQTQWIEEVTSDGIGGPTLAPFALRATSNMRVARGDRELSAYLDEIAAKGRRPFVVAPWSLLTERLDDLLALGPVSVVFDESHLASQSARVKYKLIYDAEQDENVWQTEEKENRSHSALKLARAARRRLCTTATPVGNRIWDLWGQLTLVEPDAWGKTVSRFKRRYGDCDESGWNGTLKPRAGGKAVSNEDELNSRMAATRSLIPREVSHGQLPPKRRRVTWLTTDQLVAELPGSAKEMAALSRKAAHGDEEAKFAVSDLRRMLAASQKRPVVVQTALDYLIGSKNKVIIFTGRKLDCDELGRQLTRRAKGVQVWAAHGDTSQADRDTIKKSYMAHEGPCCLVGTWHAWGDGLNLQDSDVLIFAMVPLTPKEVQQGEGRVHRLGMTRPVMVEYLLAEGTVDEHFAHLLLDKLPAVEKVADASGLSGMVEGLKGDADALEDSLIEKLKRIAENADPVGIVEDEDD